LIELPDRHAVAARWLRWAAEDLRLAEHTAADDELVSRGACIWAHQAAETERPCYHRDVDAIEVRTAAEVERLTPDERQRLVNERSSTDLNQIPEDFVGRARGRRPAPTHRAQSHRRR
jgi:hypothetical protein